MNAAPPFFFTFILLSTWSCFAQSPPAVQRPEAICGFTSNYRYGDADKVRQGLSVDLLVGNAAIDQPVNLRFYISRKPGGFPVDDLQVEHERLIHVIGVKEDLSGFFHIHPLKTSSGTWLANYTFTNGGNYKIWSDVKYQTVSYGFAHPLLTVSGKIAVLSGVREIKDRVTTAGYEITLAHSEPLLVGKTNRLEFLIFDGARNQILTEDYLGAPMHLVIIRDDLSVYLHAHPEHRQDVNSPDPIRFSELFPQPGTYKLFAQFRPRKCKLPLDDALLAEFYIHVETGLQAAQSAAK